MSVSSNGIQALNFIGRLDRKDEMLILNQGQQQAVLKRLLKGATTNSTRRSTAHVLRVTW